MYLVWKLLLDKLVFEGLGMFDFLLRIIRLQLQLNNFTLARSFGNHSSHLILQPLVMFLILGY